MTPAALMLLLLDNVTLEVGPTLSPSSKGTLPPETPSMGRCPLGLGLRRRGLSGRRCLSPECAHSTSGGRAPPQVSFSELQIAKGRFKEMQTPETYHHMTSSLPTKAEGSYPQLWPLNLSTSHPP